MFRQRNLAFLDEQVRAAQARFDVGEGTRTDVEQARASRPPRRRSLKPPAPQRLSSAAVYRQLTGSEPGNLQSPSAVAGHAEIRWKRSRLRFPNTRLSGCAITLSIRACSA
jgi:outer membrane protein TolC